MLGAGLPSLLSIGGTLKVTRYFGAGVNVGIIPQTQIAYYGDATLAYQEYDVYGRIYPFGGGFFLGAGVGYAHARGTLKLADLPFSVEVNSEGSVQTLVLTPQLGYFHIFDSGFSAGFDLGAQIPLSASDIELETTLSGPIPPAAMPIVAEHLEANDARVRDTLETIGRTPLPTINFKIGWLL